MPTNTPAPITIPHYTNGVLNHVWSAWYRDISENMGSIPASGDKVAIDASATADYLGAASNDGALRVDSSLDYADGGDYVTISLDATLKSYYDAAYAHVTADGSSHSDVVLNSTHRASAGTDHSDVVLNNTHRASDGKDHSDVVLNNTHRTSDGTDHGYIDQDVQTTASPTHVGATYSGLTASRVVFTGASKELASGASDITAAEMEELTDGSTTTLHAHAGGGITIGDAIASGTANCVLYEDASNNIAETSGFEFDGTNTITIPSSGAYQIGGNQVLAGTGTVLECGDDVDGGTAAIFTGVGTDIGSSVLSGTRNVLVGNSIANGFSASKTGSDNVLIGYRIAGAGVGLSLNARQNVIIGSSGAYYMSSATSNTGAGYKVMQGLITGFGNTCFGAETGGAISSANGNTLFGYKTGSSGNTSDRTLFGYNLNISGAGNVAMAYGTSVTTGQNNVLMGTYVCGDSNPNYTVTLGYYAGRYTSDRTVSIGYQSGALYNASKEGSTYVGFYAGRQIAGDNSVVVGREASGEAVSRSTDRVVILGAYAGFYNATDNRFIVDDRKRTDAATEVVEAILHGDMSATVSDQELRINANTLIRHALYGVPDEITATDAGVAASLTTINTEVTTNGDSDLDNVTLANGTSGQIKHIYCVAVGNAADSFKITPANMVGGTQITFAASPIGLGCTLVYADNEGWVVVANNGGTIT